MCGLLERDIKNILEAVVKYQEIDSLVIFGSRALGNYKKYSDIDLVLVGKGVTRRTLRGLNEDLNENYPLPYFFDL